MELLKLPSFGKWEVESKVVRIIGRFFYSTYFLVIFLNFYIFKFSDPDKCYAIVSQDSKMFIGVRSLLYNGFHECIFRKNRITKIEEIWRFIKVDFNSINNQNIYRIQNCNSNEYLTIEFDTHFEFEAEFKIFVSKNPNIPTFGKRYAETNNWRIIPFEDGESYVIKPYFDSMVATIATFNDGFLVSHRNNSNLIDFLYESQLFYPKK